MPVYEFYCRNCNTIFNFFSKTINTRKVPKCPKCKTPNLSRQISLFSVSGNHKEDKDVADLPLEEGKMEQAMAMLAGEAEKINEDDPRQAADLMRKLSDMSGLKLSSGMEEALSRLENGQDPEAIEAELGDIMDSEDPFVLPGKKTKHAQSLNSEPLKDDTLYDL